MHELNVNGRSVRVDCDAATPLLWVLRDLLGLTGTKYGCGKMLCGACTVHVDGSATRTCQLPVRAVAGRKITTIEGLGEGFPEGRHPVQQAWLDEAVAQCGYCQTGQIMSAAALLDRTPSPSRPEIHAAMAGNLCRCGTYQRVVRAIERAGGR